MQKHWKMWWLIQYTIVACSLGEVIYFATSKCQRQYLNPGTYMIDNRPWFVVNVSLISHIGQRWYIECKLTNSSSIPYFSVSFVWW